MSFKNYPKGLGETVQTVAREAAKLVMSAFHDEHRETTKSSPIDIVTEMDTASERLIIDRLRVAFPESNILGEEFGLDEWKGEGEVSSDWTWIIDPIDGTTNYAHSHPMFSISIALVHKTQGVAIGCVYNPPMNEMFFAEKGQGATLNGRKLAVSSTQELVRSIVSAGLNRGSTPKHNNLNSFRRMVMKVRAIRRQGSAALELCWVAAGRQDAHYALRLHSWDIAAGLLILQEAGGKMTTDDGITPIDFSRPFIVGQDEEEDRYVFSVLASNGHLHDQVATELKASKAEPIYQLPDDPHSLYPPSLPDTIKATAKEAGDLVMTTWLSSSHEEEVKASAIDVVTEMDKASEAHIIARLSKALPGANILAEESGETVPMAGSEGSDSLGKTPWRWLIDPIDGTTNYAHAHPLFTISIALEHKDHGIVLGCVYNPPMDELFFALKGKGATLNGKPISVSRTTELISSVLSTGFNTDRTTSPDNNLNAFCRLSMKVRTILRQGSAALDLCWVAAGRQDAYWELRLKTWDIAAGILIVQEAGGHVSYLNSESLQLCQLQHSILASNGPSLHSKLLKELSLGYSEPRYALPK